MSATVRQSTTGYLWSEVTVDDAGQHQVHRRPGPLRETRVYPDPVVLQMLSALSVPDVVFGIAVRDGTAEHHQVPGPSSLALLIRGGLPASAAAPMAGALGRALRAVHRCDVDPERRPAAPAGALRMSRWLREGTGPGELPDVHRQFRALVGPSSVDRMLRWIDVLSRPPRPLCGLHGGAGLLLGAAGSGALYPDPVSGAVTVLVGGEIASGHPAWDLGWMIGEQLERRTVVVDDGPRIDPGSDPMTAALLDGYGPHDGSIVCRAAVVRWLTHLHDYAGYVGGNADLPRRLALLAPLVADPSRVLQCPAPTGRAPVTR